MLKKKDYLNVIDTVLHKINKLPNYLSPTSILWSGSIQSPGISDIDLLVGFEDDFLFANEFLREFSNIIAEIENKNVYFIHMPNIYPISSLIKLSEFTFNDFSKIKVIYGKNLFNKKQNKINHDQLIIR